MTESVSTSCNHPTTEQLLDALRQSEPNAARDLGVELLEAGKVRANSTIADLGNAIRDHHARAR